jgi:hypothetical protein
VAELNTDPTLSPARQASLSPQVAGWPQEGFSDFCSTVLAHRQPMCDATFSSRRTVLYQRHCVSETVLYIAVMDGWMDGWMEEKP